MQKVLKNCFNAANAVTAAKDMGVLTSQGRISLPYPVMSVPIPIGLSPNIARFPVRGSCWPNGQTVTAFFGISFARFIPSNPKCAAGGPF
jgi:hypothetical protein